jgi:hypothetical protein
LCRPNLGGYQPHCRQGFNLFAFGLSLGQAKRWQLNYRESRQISAGNDLANRGIEQVTGVKTANDKNDQQKANEELKPDGSPPMLPGHAPLLVF